MNSLVFKERFALLKPFLFLASKDDLRTEDLRSPETKQPVEKQDKPKREEKR